MTRNSLSKKEVDKIQKSKNNPNFNVSQYLYKALGVEVTKIYGIKEITALTIFSETGANLKGKHSGQDYDKIYEDSDRDYWMKADKAKEYGMIDEVLSRG